MAPATLVQPEIVSQPKSQSPSLPAVAGQKSVAKAKSLRVRELMPIYWRKLIELGVPINEAKTVAWIIARYDVAKRLPNSRQRQIIHYYCRFVCRAELWRVQLLLDSPA
jgi:hypothetical protein